MKPFDSLDSSLVRVLEETRTLVLVGQGAEERLGPHLRHQGHVHRGQQHHEGPGEVGQDVQAPPQVLLVVPGLHLHPPAQTDGLEEGRAGVGAEVIVTDQNAHLSSHSSDSVRNVSTHHLPFEPPVRLSLYLQELTSDDVHCKVRYHLHEPSHHARQVLRHGPTHAEVEALVPDLLLLEREHHDPGPARGPANHPRVVVLDEVEDGRTRVPVSVTAREVGGASVLVIDLEDVVGEGPGPGRDAVPDGGHQVHVLRSEAVDSSLVEVGRLSVPGRTRELGPVPGVSLRHILRRDLLDLTGEEEGEAEDQDPHPGHPHPWPGE